MLVVAHDMVVGMEAAVVVVEVLVEVVFVLGVMEVKVEMAVILLK